MADEFDLVKISELPAATTPGEYDVLAGVQTGDTKQFSFAVLLSWMQQAITATAIGAVPQGRKINNHALTSDITLTAADVSAIPTSDKGVAGGVAELGNDGKVPPSQLPAIASSAADVTYDNTTSGLQADDVQEAIDELAAGAGGSTASTTTYDNTDSGLSATNVQGAIDEIVDEKADQATVAPVEASTTASAAHPLGSIFYLSGVLYRALSDIAIGDTINTAAGGNATQTTVAQNFKRTVTLTAAQYAQLSAAEKTADIVYIITDDNAISASDVSFDNTSSRLGATNVGGALVELDDEKVPVYGMGENLLRNWYFVGGGTGRGVFPVNQRGQSSYSGATSVFDGWTADANTSITFGSAGITVSLLSGSSTNIYQRVGKAPLGQSITMSILTGNGLVTVSEVMPSTLPSSNQTVLAVGASADGYRFRLYLQPAGTMYVEFRAYTTQTWVAAKLELGTQQTLAHLEGSTWVLNEIPDYEKELIKCQTSTADSNDTYANKSIATEQQIAYVESGSTASRAYAVGEYFCRDGQTCRAKTAIAQGATLTLDTNYEVPAGGGLNSIVKRNTSALTGTATGTATNVIYYNDFLVQIHFVSAGITWAKGDSLGTIPAELRPPMEVKAVAGTPSGTSVQLSINPSNGGIFAQNDNNVTARLSFNVIYMR